MSDIKISQEDFEKLENSYIDLNHLAQKLNNVVHPDIIKELEKIKKNISSVIKDEQDKEEANFDKAYKHCSKIQDENKFSSVWSIYENTDFEAKFSKKKVQSITYEGVETTPNKVLTWLEMWKEADKLIKLSGDDHHIFIENFNEVKPGHYELSTGS